MDGGLGSLGAVDFSSERIIATCVTRSRHAGKDDETA